MRLLSSKQRILRPGGVRAGRLLFNFRTIRIIFIEFRRKENKFHQDSTPYVEQNGHALSMTVFPCEHPSVYPPRALRGDQLGEHFLFTFHALYVEINFGKAFFLEPDKLRQRQPWGCDLMSCGIYPHHYYMRFIVKSQIL